jgi:predicted nucleotidyltransferase component of viral defense system
MDPHHHESSITRKLTLLINTWLALSDEQKAGLFNEAAAQKGLPAYAVEKDWWVTVTLNAIFTSKLAKHFIFKRGTLLSNAYNLIERFSEDIDLAIDRAYLGFSGELTKTSIKKLRKASGSFIISEFKDDLVFQLRI